MTAIAPQFNALSEATVRRLVANLETRRDRRGRACSLSGLLAIHLLSGIGDGQGPEDAADFARDHAAWLRRLGILGDRIPGARTLRCLLQDPVPQRPRGHRSRTMPIHAPGGLP